MFFECTFWPDDEGYDIQEPDIPVCVGQSDQISRQKKELLVVCEERDNHQLDKELLTNRLRHLEGEIEASKNSYNEKTREIRILEVEYQQLLSWGPNHDTILLVFVLLYACG